MKLILASFLTANGKGKAVYTYTASDESTFEVKDVINVPVGPTKRLAKVEVVEVISGEKVQEELDKLPFPVSKLTDITDCPKVEEEDNA